MTIGHGRLASVGRLTREMTMPLRKLRTREHVIADLGVNYVERQVLLCGGSVQRIYSDYGYDLMVSSFNARGEIEGGNAFFQVKATDDLPLLADGKTISWVVSRRDPRLWMNEACPVILAVYDVRRNRAFWLHVQAYFSTHASAELFFAGQTINVHLQLTDRLNARSIRTIVRRKNLIQARLLGKERPDA